MIMTEPPSETKITPQEFRDFMQRGDDFYKIELWRPAKAWYRRALEYNIEPDKVRKQIAACDRLIAYEVKVIWIIFAIALFAAALILLLK
jgi:hypothetical protein